MYHTLAKIYLVGQVVFSVFVMLLSLSWCVRCLFAGQLFCAVLFFIMGYVSGYLLLFRASVKELREFNAKRLQAKQQS